MLTEFEGKPVKPIKYDYQIIEYARGPGGAVVPSVVQGSGARKRVIPCMPITARRSGGGTLLFQAPLFIDMEIPGRGRYQAWEIYDFAMDPAWPRGAAPYLTWARQGASPPFAATASPGAVMHLAGERVTSYAALPASVRAVIEGDGDYALFKAPPADMAEVEGLQQAAAAARAAAAAAGGGGAPKRG